MVLQRLKIGVISVSNRLSMPVWAVVVVVLVVAVRLEPAFFFCSLALCLLPCQSLSDQSDFRGEGCRADCTQNGHGGFLLLHVLQVNVIMGLVVPFILGLAVIGMVLVVVVTVDLVHKFSGLFAFGRANLLMSCFLTLDLPFFCLFSSLFSSS